MGKRDDQADKLNEVLPAVMKAVYNEVVHDCGETMATAAAHAAKSVIREAIADLYDD